MEKSRRSISTVADIQIIDGHGPWNTKSGGILNVLLAIPLPTLQKRFFRYQHAQRKHAPNDIRGGLRVYTVSDLPYGQFGSKEWHKIREEMVFTIEGSVKWVCEDAVGGKKNFILAKGSGIWMPSFILHTYEVIEEGSVLLVIANTLFFPNDPGTHDTYSMVDFRALQTEHAAQ